MIRLTIALLVTLFVPAGVFAASGPSSFLAAHELLATSSSPGNSYTAGASVVVTAPTAGDLTIVAGSIVAAGPVLGDALLLGGSISTRSSIKNDVRAAGVNVTIDEPVGGDLIAVGYNVTDTGRIEGSVLIAAANASLSGGAAGPVTIYANNVFLAGDFAKDVKIVAGGSVTLSKDTIIRGKLIYEAPDVARIPSTASVVGGIEYTNASYLPDAGTSRALAFASLSIFILVRILGALILAGLLAGLFPSLAKIIAVRASQGRFRSIFLTALLGFATIVATPILLVLLAITFVGLGVSVLLGIAYALLLSLAFMYAGILIGTLLVRYFIGRQQVLWHDGVLGTFLLSLIALIPFIGWIIGFLLMAFTTGVLLSLFFRFAFPRGERGAEMI